MEPSNADGGEMQGCIRGFAPPTLKQVRPIQSSHPRRSRWFWLSVVLVVTGLILLIRVQRRDGAIKRWMAEMRAKGEKFTLEELVTARTWQPDNLMDMIETAASR